MLEKENRSYRAESLELNLDVLEYLWAAVRVKIEKDRKQFDSADREKKFTDFISNNRDKNRKLSNLLVKIYFDFNNNLYSFVSGKQLRK